DDFLFSLCDASFRSVLYYDPTIPGDPLPYTMVVQADVPQELVTATLERTGGGTLLGYHATYPRVIGADGSLQRMVMAPRVSCDNGKTLTFVATAVGRSGRQYTHDGACRRMVGSAPSCEFQVSLEQQFGYCKADPATLEFVGQASSSVSNSRATFDIGPEAHPTPLGELEVFGPGASNRTFLFDPAGLAEGTVPTRGRLVGG